MAKGKNLEASMEALEQVLQELEQEDISLENSFQLYQEGMKLLKECNNSIDKVEKQMIILNEKEIKQEES
ncbi:MAG: exodeoxyribonuclease VII small subunit [Velocimicrobium sp.]